jgi:hypothetical protein
MSPLDLVNLTALMERTRGRVEIAVGLIDGPVARDHPDLEGDHIHEVPGGLSSRCRQVSSPACTHGTLVAGILSGKRGSPAPAICPNCTLLVCPIFAEAAPGPGRLPSATPGELAAATIRCIDVGARVLTISAALTHLFCLSRFVTSVGLDCRALR